MRSIGSSCYALLILNISYDKLITNIGINSLTISCHKLKTLICRGLHFLSDQMSSSNIKSDSTKSVKLHVGIASIAVTCKNLEFIDLTGCFALNKSIKYHLGKLDNLKHINFSGLKELTADSLSGFFQNCHNIETINLSDCAKAVNNNAIENLVKYSKTTLTEIILSRCEGIRGAALRALSQCCDLIKLDLTGCKAVTDIMMIPICENNLGKLKYLILAGLRLITDSTIGWLSMLNQSNEAEVSNLSDETSVDESKSKSVYYSANQKEETSINIPVKQKKAKETSLILLALKGTSVSYFGLQAFQQYFKNCDLIHNDNFFGFWPKYRVEDQCLMDQFANLNYAIIYIQSKYRQVR